MIDIISSNWLWAHLFPFQVVRKAIAMIQKLAEDEEKYEEFWDQFGTSIKLGALEDTNNRARLEKLLRFRSSAAEGLTGFEDYVSRMKEGQKSIYFFAQQEDISTLKQSPLLERLLKNGYEVLFMTEAIDEYLFQAGSITKFEDYEIVNIAKENLKLDDEEVDEEEQEAVKEEFKPLCDYLKKTLARKIMNCKVSDRLTESPSALTSAQWGWTANMERIAKSQPLADKSMASMMKSQKIMEINPTHPIVVELKNRVSQEGEEGEAEADLAHLLYDTALLSSGYEMEDPHSFSARIHRVMSNSLGLPASVKEDVAAAEGGYYEEL